MKKLGELLSKSQSVALNTKSEDGHPFSSYASFYYDGELIYVSIPDIMTHIENIESTPKLSALFVEDERASQSRFERHKVTLECDVEQIEEESSTFKEIMPKFEEATLGILIGVQRCNLYALKPTSGEVIVGLGESYSLDDF